MGGGGGVAVWGVVWRDLGLECGGESEKKTCSLSASLLGVGMSTTTGPQWQNQPRVGVCLWL